MGAMETLSVLVDVLPILVANLHFVLLGVFVGMSLGTLPGMGGSVTLAILIPISLGLPPESAFILYGAALGSTTFSGAITAILLNTPGTASNVATLLDGYPLARQGRGKEAIGAAATASATGAFIGLFIFLLLVPVIRQFALLFGSVELFWLAVFGIAIIPAVTKGGLTKGLIAGVFGVVLALHGFNIVTGEFRFEYIRFIVEDGNIGVVPVVVGLFAVGEMLSLATRNESQIGGDEEGEAGGDLLKGIREPFKHKLLVFQSAIIGTIIGAVPGAGGPLSSLLAYSQGSNLSDEEFGAGNIEGVIASEAANDAKDGGQLIPVFGLGIPGSPSTAVLLGAFLVHGLTPGPQFISEFLPIVLLVFLSLLLSNVLTSIIGIATSRWIVLVTKVDVAYLFPGILSFTLFAAFLARNNFGDVLLAGLFGIVGFVFILLEVSRVPVMLALVLTNLLEQTFHRVLVLGGGQWTGFVSSPISIALVLIILFILLRPQLSLIRRLTSGRFGTPDEKR